MGLCWSTQGKVKNQKRAPRCIGAPRRKSKRVPRCMGTHFAFHGPAGSAQTGPPPMPQTIVFKRFLTLFWGREDWAGAALPPSKASATQHGSTHAMKNHQYTLVFHVFLICCWLCKVWGRDLGWNLFSDRAHIQKCGWICGFGHM